MAKQTVLMTCIVLCSLGGWYVLISKYLELKTLIKEKFGADTSETVAAHQSNPNYPDNNEMYHNDFSLLPEFDLTDSSHIAGMGPPPLPNMPFKIPDEVISALKQRNYDNANEAAAKMQSQTQQQLAAQRASTTSNTPHTEVAAVNLKKRELCNWACLMHISGLGFITGLPFLNIILPSILWLLKKDQHRFLDKQGRDIINFQITFTLLQFACLALGTLFIWIMPETAAHLMHWTRTPRVVFTTGMNLPFNMFNAIPFFWGCIMVIRGAVAGYHGVNYKYPYAQRFIFEYNPETPTNVAVKPVQPQEPQKPQTTEPVVKNYSKINFG